MSNSPCEQKRHGGLDFAYLLSTPMSNIVHFPYLNKRNIVLWVLVAGMNFIVFDSPNLMSWSWLVYGHRSQYNICIYRRAVIQAADVVDKYCKGEKTEVGPSFCDGPSRLIQSSDKRLTRYSHQILLVENQSWSNNWLFFHFVYLALQAI